MLCNSLKDIVPTEGEMTLAESILSNILPPFWPLLFALYAIYNLITGKYNEKFIEGFTSNFMVDEKQKELDRKNEERRLRNIRALQSAPTMV